MEKLYSFVLIRSLSCWCKSHFPPDSRQQDRAEVVRSAVKLQEETLGTTADPVNCLFSHSAAVSRPNISTLPHLMHVKGLSWLFHPDITQRYQQQPATTWRTSGLTGEVKCKWPPDTKHSDTCKTLTDCQHYLTRTTSLLLRLPATEKLFLALVFIVCSSDKDVVPTGVW